MAIQFAENLAAIVAHLELEAKRKVLMARNELRNEWLSVLSGSRSGRTYRIPGTRRTYTASAPGEAPAVRFGDLRRSIKITEPVKDGNDIKCYVGSDLIKALHLELGTRKMRPRPHFRVAVENSADARRAIMNEPLRMP